MVEPKFLLSMNPQERVDRRTFAGTLDDIISWLEQLPANEPDPLLWAEEIAHDTRCTECGEHFWDTSWWYWEEQLAKKPVYYGYRPTPDSDTVLEFAYAIMRNRPLLPRMMGQPTITLHPLPEEDN